MIPMVFTQAYLDPSATTALITGVASVAVAVGAFVVVMFRKAKKKVSDKLGIEENKNKEVEEVEFIEEEQNEENNN